MMEQHLRACCNYEQDNWVELLPLGEFAYNNSIRHSTLMTRFCANYNYYPTMQLKPPNDPSFISQVQADSWMAGVERTHRILWENIIKAAQGQTMYTSRKKDDLCGWRQSMAIDQELEIIQAFKKA